jgi:glycine/D-amino acid oxidase-like deaminating enzyme
VVGGGYSGLWTAWHVLRTAPDARVVVLEADVCGHGPSGRNGGFVEDLWLNLPAMQERFGSSGALRIAEAAEESVVRSRRGARPRASTRGSGAAASSCPRRAAQDGARDGVALAAATAPRQGRRAGRGRSRQLRVAAVPRGRCWPAARPCSRRGWRSPAGRLSSAARVFEHTRVRRCRPRRGGRRGGHAAARGSARRTRARRRAARWRPRTPAAAA